MTPTLLSRAQAMNELREIVGKAVDRYRMREGKGLTQAEVSKKIGMSTSYLAVLKMDGGDWRVSSETLEKIIKSLGIPSIEAEQARIYLAAAQVENDGIRSRILEWLEALPSTVRAVPRRGQPWDRRRGERRSQTPATGQ